MSYVRKLVAEFLNHAAAVSQIASDAVREVADVAKEIAEKKPAQ